MGSAEVRWSFIRKATRPSVAWFGLAATEQRYPWRYQPGANMLASIPILRQFIAVSPAWGLAFLQRVFAETQAPYADAASHFEPRYHGQKGANQDICANLDRKLHAQSA